MAPIFTSEEHRAQYEQQERKLAMQDPYDPIKHRFGTVMPGDEPQSVKEMWTKFVQPLCEESDRVRLENTALQSQIIEIGNQLEALKPKDNKVPAPKVQ